MKVSEEDVKQIATLAKLSLSKDDVLLYQEQMIKFLNYVEILNNIPTSSQHSESDMELWDFEQHQREDKVTHLEESGFGLKQSSDVDGNYFRVPSIIETE